MKLGAMGPNGFIPKQINKELYVCKKGFIIIDAEFYEGKTYEFSECISINTKTARIDKGCYTDDNIFIDENQFFNYFYTKAEWREKQIDSILE